MIRVGLLLWSDISDSMIQINMNLCMILVISNLVLWILINEFDVINWYDDII
jgi:hypothetical protein